jgi:hypothetical protein
MNLPVASSSLASSSFTPGRIGNVDESKTNKNKQIETVPLVAAK